MTGRPSQGREVKIVPGEAPRASAAREPALESDISTQTLAQQDVRQEQRFSYLQSAL
jgi:hypothetical protein